MLYTVQNVKDNIRNRQGKRVFFLAAGDKLTPGASEYLRQERIEILDAAEAKTEVYRLVNGGTLSEKPEHFTHLYGDVLVEKTHPRIAFRGKMDSLEAELLLAQKETQGQICKDLGQVLEFTRKLIRYDVLDEPVKESSLCGLTEKELRLHSHFPQKYYSQPHFMPADTDSRGILQVNRARCAAREAELAAVAAFSDREGNPTRVDILQAMNRLSSMLWILIIRMKKEQEDHGA